MKVHVKWSVIFMDCLGPDILTYVNAIYCITYTHCKKIYTGENRRILSD